METGKCMRRTDMDAHVSVSRPSDEPAHVRVGITIWGADHRIPSFGFRLTMDEAREFARRIISAADVAEKSGDVGMYAGSLNDRAVLVIA